MFKNKTILTDGIKNLAINDYLKGMSYRMVGEKYKVNHKTVRRWVIKSGNRIRTREEAYKLESERTKGDRRSPITEFKKGQNPWNKGTKGVMKVNKASFKKGDHASIDTEFKKGKEHPCYIDGRGYCKYSHKFNNKLKNKIRIRDNHRCQNCGMTEEEHLMVYGRKLEIHHINYNKKDCEENNLITLCKKCNMKANNNRIHWECFYKNKMKGRESKCLKIKLYCCREGRGLGVKNLPRNF